MDIFDTEPTNQDIGNTPGSSAFGHQPTEHSPKTDNQHQLTQCATNARLNRLTHGNNVHTRR